LFLLKCLSLIIITKILICYNCFKNIIFFSESSTEVKKKAKTAQITSDLSSTESYKKNKKENMKISMKRARNNLKQQNKLPKSNKPSIFTNNISGIYLICIKLYNNIFLIFLFCFFTKLLQLHLILILNYHIPR